MTSDALAQLGLLLAEGKSEALTTYLTAMAKFHRYSFCNQLLIAFQTGGRATRVAGFNAWRKLHRFVKKGEKGIVIMAPVTRVVGTVKQRDEDDAEASADLRSIVNVKPVYVFDISQTDGQPLPEFASVRGDPKGYTSKLKSLLASKSIGLEYASNIGGALGASSGQKIRILQGLDPAEEFAVLVHELAHAMLHAGKRGSEVSRTIRETEAEAVAFVVCQAVGLHSGTAASDYIQLYRGDGKTLAESLNAIRDTASEIIATISAGP